MESQRWEMNKQTDLQDRKVSVLLQPNTLFNTAWCRTEGWNWCQPSISHGFPPCCSSLRARQALYCFSPCPLPFSDINNSFSLFLMGNKEEQRGSTAALSAAGLPTARQPLPALRFTLRPRHSDHHQPRQEKHNGKLATHFTDLVLKFEALVPVLGISLTDPHYPSLLALSSHRAPAMTEGIISPWWASILHQILQEKHVLQHCWSRGEPRSIRAPLDYQRKTECLQRGGPSEKGKKKTKTGKPQRSNVGPWSTGRETNTDDRKTSQK